MTLSVSRNSRSRSRYLRVVVAIATATLLAQVVVGSVAAAYDTSRCTTSQDGTGQVCVDVTYTLGSGNVRYVSAVTGWIVVGNYSPYYTTGKLTIYYNTGTYQDQFNHRVASLTVYSHAVSFSPSLQVSTGTCYAAMWSAYQGLMVGTPLARVCLS